MFELFFQTSKNKSIQGLTNPQQQNCKNDVHSYKLNSFESVHQSMYKIDLHSTTYLFLMLFSFVLGFFRT